MAPGIGGPGSSGPGSSGPGIAGPGSKYPSGGAGIRNTGYPSALTPDSGGAELSNPIFPGLNKFGNVPDQGSNFGSPNQGSNFGGPLPSLPGQINGLAPSSGFPSSSGPGQTGNFGPSAASGGMLLRPI